MKRRGPKRKRLTPQEKKALSLQRDRRNVYGEAPHAARRAIPLRKRKEARRLRKAAKAALRADPENAAAAASAKPRWRKVPDAPLGVVVADQLDERAFLRATAGRGPRGRARAQWHNRQKLSRDDATDR